MKNEKMYLIHRWCAFKNTNLQLSISADRRWRQEKLYKQMTDTCIDEVKINFLPKFKLRFR